MTKKDYVLIASVLKTEYDYENSHKDTVLRITLNLSKMLKLDNPRFDENRFLEAVGITSIVLA